MGKRILSLLAITILLSACGDEETSTTQDTASSATSTHRFFLDANGDLNYVKATDASAKGIVQTDDPTPVNFNYSGGEYGGAIYGGSGNSTSVGDFHRKALIFSDGTNIVKVSTGLGATPVVEQVSSENTMANFCTGTFDLYSDFASPNNSVIIYKVFTSGNCSTGTTERRWTTLGTDKNTVFSSNALGVVAPVYNASGGLDKFIVEDSNTLKFVNADFDPASLTTITHVDGMTAADTSTDLIYMGASSTNTFLFLIDDGSGYKLYSYDVTGTQLSAQITNATNLLLSSSAKIEDDYIYYMALTGIYRYPLDGSATSTLIVDAGATVNSFYLTPTRVVYQSGGTTDVYSVLKTASDPATVTTLKDSAGANIIADSIEAVAGEWVYYMDTTSGTANIAGMVMADGMGAGEHKGTVTVNTVDADFGANWVLKNYSQTMDKNLNNPLSHIVLDEVTSLSMSSVEVHTLTSYNASSHTVAAVIGTIENNNINYNNGQKSGYGSVDMAFLQVGTGSNVDLYMWNAAGAGSLTVVDAGVSTNINAPTQSIVTD